MNFLQKKSLFFILVTLFFATSAFAEGKTIAVIDFEGPESTSGYWREPMQTSITTDQNEVISGKASLKMDTTNNKVDRESLLFVVLSNAAPLQGGKRYAVSFDYKVIDINYPESCFFLVAKSKMLKGPDKNLQRFKACPASPGRHVHTIYLTPNIDDYRINFGIEKRGSIILDNIKIEQLPDIDLSEDGQVVPDKNYEPFGICTHLDRLSSHISGGYTDEQVVKAVKLMKDADIQWFRIGVSWADIEPVEGNFSEEQLKRTDLVVDTAIANGLNIYILLLGQPQWISEKPDEKDAWAYAPKDAAKFEKFIGMLTKRYKDKVKAWELGNEIDWLFWKSDLKTYVNAILKPGYKILKAVDPNNQVIMGSLAFDGTYVWNFWAGAKENALQQLYDAGAKDYFDILSMHPYCDDFGSGTIESIDKINITYGTMVKNGDGDKQIWLTELGKLYNWSSPENEQYQAQYLKELYTQLIKHPKVAKIFWYNFRCKTGEGYKENTLGIVNNDFTLRPAYNTLKDLPKSIVRKVNYNFLPEEFRNQAKSTAGDTFAKSNSALVNAANKSVDYAASKHWQEWTHHPVFGDASFDNFERLPGNPVCRGTEEYQWPVNGSLFKDPVSRDWFLYVGWYKRAYARGQGVRTHCTVYCSKDKGKTWNDLGEPIAGIGSHRFGESILWNAPDAVVCFKDGLYHMSFSWSTQNFTWENAWSGAPDHAFSGAYACSVSPAGTFKPVVAYITNRDTKPFLGKYRRFYGPTLLPREKDWIALALTDSNEYYGWGLVGQTAQKPDGQWSEPKLLLHPQLNRYFPQLLEFFPAFIHSGFIYAPATSIAANRNYQVIFRTPVEKAMDSNAWEIFQEGSLWHAEPIESEYEGIWGQTFSGFIDDDGMFYVMFPSRDSQNRGTINLARRPWNKPLRKQGFVVSGHSQPSMTVIRHDIQMQRLNAMLKVCGTVQIIWNHHGPFGADRQNPGCGLHPLMRTQFDALELSKNTWKLIQYGKDGQRKEIAAGQTVDMPEHSVELDMDGQHLKLKLNGRECWDGAFNSAKGQVGIWVEARSSADVEKFEVKGIVSNTSMDFLYTEAIQCAAQNMKDWEKVDSEKFRYGQGVISRSDLVEVKWNFIGDGFAIWAPTGPIFGKGELWLDGERLALINFYTGQEETSDVLYKKRSLLYGRHGLTLKVVEGRVPVDVLEVYIP